MRTEASVSTWSSTTRIVRPVGSTCLRPVIDGLPVAGGPRVLARSAPSGVSGFGRALCLHLATLSRSAPPTARLRFGTSVTQGVPSRAQWAGCLCVCFGRRCADAVRPSDDLLTLRQARDCDPCPPTQSRQGDGQAWRLLVPCGVRMTPTVLVP